MRSPLDIVGKRFGKLIVESRSKNNRFGGSMWSCMCDCGKVVTVVGGSLNCGHSKSCGCLREEVGKSNRQRPPKDARAHEVYLSCSSGAERRGIEFRLSKEDVLMISSLPCNYCGGLPEESTYRMGGRNTRERVGSGLFVHGIDRVDNGVGYTLENSVPCCKVCNFMKGKLGIRDFKNHIKKINNHLADFNFSLANMCTDKLAVLEFISKAA